jgi:hypothetical protein
MADLLILAHGGTWDMRFQTSALAASVAAGGDRVDLALFFGALEAWAMGRWDELDPQPPLSLACSEQGRRGGSNLHLAGWRVLMWISVTRWIGFCSLSVVRSSSAPTERAAAT